MAGTGVPLDSRQAGQFATVMRLLQAGQPAQALVPARQLAQQAPDAADAHQLLAMVLADNGMAEAAGEAFERACALAPHSEVVTSNYAVWLLRQQRGPEALEVLAALPATAASQTRLGQTALQLGQMPRACEAFAHALQLQQDSVAAWQGLGVARRALGDLDAAETAFRRATGLAATDPVAWINLGGVLRLLGRIDEALACMRRAQALGHATPELDDAINGLLLDAGRPADALAGARSLVAAHPGHPSAQSTLANILWEHGDALAPRQDPLHAFRSAVLAQPRNRDLQLGFVRTLLAMRRPEEALRMLQPLRTGGDDALLDWFAAEALDALGEHGRATALFARVHRVMARSPAFLNAHARHAFRSGRPGLAQSCAEQAVGLAPGNQEAWSLLGTAWRLAGDPREDWLFGYERLIGEVEVGPPAGHADTGAFLDVLASTLDSLHQAGREPVSQSVRNGSQTSGRLFGRDDAVLRDAETALRGAVERWLALLPVDPGHPFLAHRQDSVRFVGSWSVRLTSSGRHTSHIHNEGWMSSAFYVALPAPVRDPLQAGHAGWIQFGQPLETLGLALPPRRLMRPKVGHLVLFPSYMWHGTLPFEDVAPRLTVAFDMQPRPMK